MERIRKEPLFDIINSELADTLKKWHGSPYSSVTAGKINTLIRLGQSAGYGISLEINRKSWEDNNAAELLPNLRFRMDGEVAIVEINPQQKADGSETHLYAHVDNPVNPLDEFSASYSYFVIVGDGKKVDFAPQEVVNIKISKERTFRTLKEVKDTYWPNMPDEEFLMRIQRKHLRD